MPLWTSNILEPWNWRCQFFGSLGTFQLGGSNLLEPSSWFRLELPIYRQKLEPWGEFGLEVPRNWNLEPDSALNFQYIGTLELEVPLFWNLGDLSAWRFQFIGTFIMIPPRSSNISSKIGTLRGIWLRGANFLTPWTRCRFELPIYWNLGIEGANFLAPWGPFSLEVPIYWNLHHDSA